MNITTIHAKAGHGPMDVAEGMRNVWPFALIFVAMMALLTASSRGQTQGGVVSGELKCWHKVVVTLDGPGASATGTPNPFLDLRMDVSFTHTASGTSYRVPGYFDADGNAANTSATSGNKWRAVFTPDRVGQWRYRVSFHRGPNVAV